MYAKICDNCNDLAAIGDQDCVKLDFRGEKLDFCNMKCMEEYLKKEDVYFTKIQIIKDRAIGIIGNQNIEKLVMLIIENRDPGASSSSNFRNNLLCKKVLYEAIESAIDRKMTDLDY